MTDIPERMRLGVHDHAAGHCEYGLVDEAQMRTPHQAELAEIQAQRCCILQEQTAYIHGITHFAWWPDT